MDGVCLREEDIGAARVSLEFAKQVLRQEAGAISALAETLGEPFEQAVQWVLECRGRVITCGVGKSGHIARKTAGTLSSTGTPSLFLHAAEAVHGDLGIVAADDVVLLYTHSGETDEIVRLFPSLRALGARTILITGREESSAAREADLVLDTCVTEEACPNNLAPTTSTTVMLALSDALALAVMDRRNFTKDDYARLHPGGMLGKRLLLTVRDAMRKGADIALVSPETFVLDVMRAITRAGAGSAAVVDGEQKLLGFITEGDVRRHFMNSADPMRGTAREMMTREPKTIEPNLLAIEAFEFFQNVKPSIAEVPVLENERVIGVLMLKDLLRSGIV